MGSTTATSTPEWKSSPFSRSRSRRTESSSGCWVRASRRSATPSKTRNSRRRAHRTLTVTWRSPHRGGSLGGDAPQCCLQWFLSPPGPPAEQGHGGRYQQAAHDRGVDEDRDGEANAKFFDAAYLRAAEAGEYDHHEERGRGDDTPGALQPPPYGLVAGHSLVHVLLDAGQQEDLV